MTRSEKERVLALSTINRIRLIVEAIDVALRAATPISDVLGDYDAANGQPWGNDVVQLAHLLGLRLARLDLYTRAEAEAVET